MIIFFFPILTYPILIFFFTSGSHSRKEFRLPTIFLNTRTLQKKEATIKKGARPNMYKLLLKKKKMQPCRKELTQGKALMLDHVDFNASI